MFQYDDGVLADVVWRKYVAAVEENVRLTAELEVAKIAIRRLQEMENEALSDDYESIEFTD